MTDYARVIFANKTQVFVGETPPAYTTRKRGYRTHTKTPQIEIAGERKL